jgi:hypothetical protein
MYVCTYATFLPHLLLLITTIRVVMDSGILHIAKPRFIGLALQKLSNWGTRTMTVDKATRSTAAGHVWMGLKVV